MAFPIALVLLVSALGASAASSPNGVQWRPRPRMEYEFELSSRSLAGLPALQGQYSGVQYGGRVRVQGLTADTAIIKLERMSWSSLHGRLASDWWAAEPQANASLAGHAHHGSMPMPLSGAAAVARFQDGQISTILVGREARDWEVNLLQGVLGHMQIQNGAGSNGLHGRGQQQQDQQGGVYRVLENGVSGRCIVQYEVSPTTAPAEMSAAETKMCSGKPYVQITKTKNFTDCEQYAEQSRGLPRCSPTGNACAGLWARNSITQLIGCGSGADLTLVQAVSSSSMQAELQAREDSRAAVFSSVNMTLARVQPVRERIATPKDGIVINGLGYRVGGKQVNGNWGLDSSYSESSEEGNDDSESVEVVRQHSRQPGRQQQHQDDSNDSNSSDDSNDISESNGRQQKNGYKKSRDDSSSDESSDNNGKNRSQKPKKNQNSHDSDEDQSSNRKQWKKQNSQESQDSEDSHDSEDQSSNRKQRKNQNSQESDEDQSSNGKQRKNQKNQNFQDSDEDQSSIRKQRRNQKNQDSDEDHSSNGKQWKNQSSQDSDEDRSSNGKQKKGKRSRQARSAKPQQQKGGDDADSIDDAFAGVLSPANVQKNATLRAALQQRLIQDLSKVSSELNLPDGPTSRTMERLSMAVRITRALGADQLRSVQDQLKDRAAKEIFRDVIAMCGSAPCVEQTVRMIKERKMSSLAAQMALASVADRVAVPSRNVLQQLQDLYKSSDDKQVKMAAALALGDVAHRVPRPVAASAAAFLAEQLSQQADNKSPLRAPLMHALGSTAAPQAAQALLKVANDKKVAPYQRAQAVLALRASAMRSPKMARDALLALFHDPTVSAPVRMAAVSLLVYTRPSLPVWQRLAVSTFYERNLAVASYVWSTIDSFAKMQDPVFHRQTMFARLALPLARPMPQGAHLAFNVVAGSVDAQLEHMVHQHTSFQAPVDAANAYYRRVVRNADLSTLDQEVDLWAANPDELMQSAVEAVFGPQDLKAKAEVRPALDARRVPHSTRSIHEKLNIVRRRLQDPQGHLRLTLKPFVNNLFVNFDKNTPNRVAMAAIELMDKLRSETSFHAQQMGGEEMSVSAVTEMGFPVNLRIQAPWLVRAEGSAQLHRNSSAYANLTCLYTAGLSAQLSVQPSWTNREYVAAVNGHAMVQMPPTTLRAQMNTTDGRLSVRMEPASGRDHSVLARLAAQPLTASLDLSRGELASESASVHNASRAQGAPHTVPQPVELSPWAEVSLSLRAPIERAGLAAWLRHSRPVLGFPVLGRPLTASRLELVASYPRAVNVSVSLVKAMMQSGDMEVMYPAALRWEDESAKSDNANPTTTEMPSTTTEAADVTTTEPSTTTTEMPSTTTESAAARPARSAFAGRAHYRHGKNGSMYVDNGEMDFSASLFNATTLNPYTNRINGSAELYMLSQVLGGMAAGRGYVVGANVTTEPSGEARTYTYSGFWTMGANLGGRLVRAGLFARSDADNAQIAATGAVLRDVPAVADLEAALRQLPALMVKAEYQQIDASAVKKIVTAALETDRSAQKERYLHQAAREQHCVTQGQQDQQGRNASVAVDTRCRALLDAANTPDQLNLTVNYNNPAEDAWKDAVHGALQAARAYLWNEGSIAVDSLTTGNGNELGSGLTIKSDGTLDGWLQTPRTLTKMVAATAPTAASTFLSAITKSSGAFCGLSTSHLTTLDGAKGRLQLDSCWHLVAKDCSGKSRVAVLARADQPNRSEDIHVEVNIDNYQVARLSPNGTATLNGAPVVNQTTLSGAAVQVRDADEVAVMTIVRAEDGAIRVHLPDHGMSLVYGNSSVIVQAGNALRGRLCGMCGNFDGNASGDLLGPANKPVKSVQALADAYALDCSSGKGRQ